MDPQLTVLAGRRLAGKLLISIKLSLVQELGVLSLVKVNVSLHLSLPLSLLLCVHYLYSALWGPNVPVM